MKYRKKVIVIPYINRLFLMVKDKKYEEWTFVTGSCKKNEDFSDCALRELYEETNGTINLQKHTDINIEKFFHYNFKRIIHLDKVILDYRVFFIPLHRFGYTKQNIFKIEKNFYVIIILNQNLMKLFY